MKKKLILLCVIFAFVPAVLLPACGRKNAKKEETGPYIYCLNSERTGLYKVRYVIAEGDPLQAAEGVISKLKASSGEIEYTPAIPKAVEVNSMELEGQILKLDFSREYLNIPELEEKLVRAAVVQSLEKIRDVNAVLITVDGKELVDSAGEKVGILTEDDFVQNTGESVSFYRTGKITLYFANEAGDRLIPVEREVTYNSNTSREKLIMEKLVKGPVGKEVYPTINSDVNFFGVTIKDGICYINFDSSFLTAQVDVTPEVTVYSIVNSIVEGTNISKVQITVNGENKITYRETVDLTQPFRENMELVGEENKGEDNEGEKKE